MSLKNFSLRSIDCFGDVRLGVTRTQIDDVGEVSEGEVVVVDGC
jgi:hypothetical protein